MLLTALLPKLQRSHKSRQEVAYMQAGRMAGRVGVMRGFAYCTLTGVAQDSTEQMIDLPYLFLPSKQSSSSSLPHWKQKR